MNLRIFRQDGMTEVFDDRGEWPDGTANFPRVCEIVGGRVVFDTFFLELDELTPVVLVEIADFVRHHTEEPTPIPHLPECCERTRPTCIH